ncbi:hypothetical protein GYMLUDRAFT_38844 [Collybiopsis luxurians FD-317 M1]|nr:hypothetical protein GYMLUDRAFT_38844 [Collybiopsis luxurians FD-317 M1]
MRRRLDIAPLPYLFPDGGMYLIDPNGNLIRYTENSDSRLSDSTSPEEGQELSAMSATFFSGSQDYVGRARYLVGSNDTSTNGILSAVDARRAIAKLERATMELRLGIPGDSDLERKTQAEVLLNAYSRELERQKTAAEEQGLVLTGEDIDINDDDDDDDDEEFHYPTSPPASIRPSSRSSSTTGYLNNRPESQRTMSDLTPQQLSQAPDFRVPTHEAPHKVKRWAAPSPHQIHQWEKDEDVPQCRDCQRRFNFIARRYHCRRCGRIFCDKCSSYRALLDPSDVVREPGYPESASHSNGSAPNAGASSSSQRVCRNCFEEVNGSVPSGIQGIRSTTMERIFVDLDQERQRLTIPHSTRRQSSSQLSDLAECPVCNSNLEEVGDAAEQEAHVKRCLDGGSGPTHQAAKYLVYRLPADSALIGVECVICLEEFAKGSMVARLSCFCSFHNVCLSSWLQRGKACPVHAR